MIFFNSLLYIVSHVPEFFVTILLIIYSKKISKFCNYIFSCELISEESDFFSLLSISCQFYVFLLFDKNFSSSFSNIKSRLGLFFFKKCFPNQTLPSNRPSNNIELKNLNKLIGNGIIDQSFFHLVCVVGNDLALSYITF